MKTYQLLIFDFDGTLVDTAPDIAYHANEVLMRFGFREANLGEVKKAIGLGVHQLLGDLGGERLKNDVELLERMVLIFKEEYGRKPVIETRPYPRVVEMLDGPLKQVQKVIVTNKPHELTLEILRQLHLSGHFKTVIGAGFGYPYKPVPDSSLAVAQSLKVAPSRALFIGDSSIDRETAKNAGMDYAWMDYGYDDSLVGLEGFLRFSDAGQWAGLPLGK